MSCQCSRSHADLDLEGQRVRSKRLAFIRQRGRPVIFNWHDRRVHKEVRTYRVVDWAALGRRTSTQVSIGLGVSGHDWQSAIVRPKRWLREPDARWVQEAVWWTEEAAGDCFSRLISFSSFGDKKADGTRTCAVHTQLKHLPCLCCLTVCLVCVPGFLFAFPFGTFADWSASVRNDDDWVGHSL